MHAAQQEALDQPCNYSVLCMDVYRYCFLPLHPCVVSIWLQRFTSSGYRIFSWMPLRGPKSTVDDNGLQEGIRTLSWGRSGPFVDL